MKTEYENSLFYQVNYCARCVKLLFEQYFKDLNLGVTSTEHLVLSVILETKDCCQRDLAKIILKDRANTGKLANSLKEKGLIKIEHKLKNNRMVKILTLTEKGKEIHSKVIEVTKPIADKIEKELSDQFVKNATNTLKYFRNIVENAVRTNI